MFTSKNSNKLKFSSKIIHQIRSSLKKKKKKDQVYNSIKCSLI